MTVIQVYAVGAAAAVAASMLSVVAFAVAVTVRQLVIDAWCRRCDRRRNAIEQAAQAAERIDVEAASAVRRLEQAYLDSAREVRLAYEAAKHEAEV